MRIVLWLVTCVFACQGVCDSSHLNLLSFLSSTSPYNGSFSPTQTKQHQVDRAQPFSFSEVVEKAAPSVVEIHTISSVNPYVNDPFFDFFFQSFGHDQPMLKQQSSGSGVVVDASGLVVTCAHVVRQAKEIHIRLADMRTLKAHVVKVDEKEDLALLQIEDDHHNLPVIQLGDAENLKVGDGLLAIGNAFGLGIAVTQGIVSAALRVVEGRVVLQTDASINPGNSGGAIVDTAGSLVAIPNAILSRSGASHGVGFARPSAIVRAMLNEYKNKGQRPWLGVKGKSLLPDQLKSLSGDRLASGWAVISVAPQSVLAQAGLQSKDIIVSLNDRPVTSSAMMRYWERVSCVGDILRFDVWRAGKRLIIECAVGFEPVRQVNVFTIPSGPLSGVEVMDASSFSSSEDEGVVAQQGVVLTKLGESMSSMVQGLMQGDVIVAWNNIFIHNLDDLKKAMTKKSKATRIVVQRGKNQQIVICID